MRILGIYCGHNATAVLMQDGEVVAALSEEKLDNIKNSAGFPAKAIAAILKEHELSAADIDHIAMASNEVFPRRCYDYLAHPSNQEELALKSKIVRSVERGVVGKLLPPLFQALRDYRYKELVEEGLEELEVTLTELDLASIPRTHVEHHECHATSAFYGLDPSAGADPALIFSLDGSGDRLCATVTIWNGQEWRRIAETPSSASLGSIYSLTTRFLGMRILEHEYKVMGLAPYCKDYYRSVFERVFEPVIRLDDRNPLVFKAECDTARFYDYLVENAVGERFDNVAGAVQHLIEERTTAWIREAIKSSGISRIFTSGGVFMNVKLNKRIQEMPEVSQCFFMPSCGDESIALGAAYSVARANGIAVQPLSDLYLGLSYSDDQISEFVNENGLEQRFAVRASDDIECDVAELLASRQIVARVSGNNEWGARSLCNRAILAHPSYIESFYTVNDQIKCRDFWMPFAPTILDSAAHKYLQDYDPDRAEAPYMITAFSATELGIKELRASIHQGDHTLRPQVLRPEHNPTYYRLVKEFEALSGIGAVLNTSFNLHGYPLAATLDQALMTFEQSGLRHMALGSFLISKE